MKLKRALAKQKLPKIQNLLNIYNNWCFINKTNNNNNEDNKSLYKCILYSHTRADGHCSLIDMLERWLHTLSMDWLHIFSGSFDLYAHVSLARLLERVKVSIHIQSVRNSMHSSINNQSKYPLHSWFIYYIYQSAPIISNSIE